MTPEDAVEPSLDLEGGLWLTISEIAERKKKSRQAISKRVKSLVEEGRIAVKDGPNGTKLVNLAAFDDAVGDIGDPVKEHVAEQRAAADQSEGANGKFRDAAAREKEYNADIKFLERAKLLGQLVPVADVQDAASKAAEAIIRVVDRLPSYGETINGACTKDGIGGARAALKEIARDLRKAIVEAMTELGQKAVGAEIDTSETVSIEDMDFET